MKLRACLASLFVLASPSAHSQTSPPAAQQVESTRPPLGLMGTIPIYWGESSGIGDILSGTAEQHWARVQLERDWHLLPLDRLDTASLAGVQVLLLAQPRALAPDENVALDAWVRQGGRLLLFADPMLTGESHFAIGDRRRPQDVILISPLLRHWGLELMFDENQPNRPILREFAGSDVPVRLPGQFASMAANMPCSIEASDLIAICAIGSGRAVVVADAALLDMHDSHPASAAALDRILAAAFTPER